MSDEKLENMSKKKLRMPFKFSRIDFREIDDDLKKNNKVITWTVIVTFIVMIFACSVVFLLNVRGPEEVLVPDVRGKELSMALMELQEKELYPRIQLRYTDSTDDAGTILEQTPRAGSIVKGYSRVSLTVSRGSVIDRIENYIGQNIGDVQIRLRTLFAGSSRPLIVLANPEYMASEADAGTILAQDPPPGTSISSQTIVKIVVSRGPEYEMIRIPNLIGSTINDVYRQMTRNKLVFNFSAHTASESTTLGTVISQQQFESDSVRAYTRVGVEFEFPEQVMSGLVYGIFSAELSEFPYALPVTLTAISPEGNEYPLVTFNHTGRNITIPYAVEPGSILELSVEGEVRIAISVD